MRKNLLILAIVAVAGYLVGVESAKARGRHYEDLRHQMERLWMDPHARKSRKRLAKKAANAAKDLGRSIDKKLS